MTLVLGLDGCPAGWCGVMIDAGDGSLTLRGPILFRSFDAALSSEAEHIAIDIPIGLLEAPGGPIQRACDVEARRLLGWPRRCSVFPPPSRPALQHCGIDYVAACHANKEVTGRALSRQAFHIGAKIKEVDAIMVPALQERVHEVHPEVCFHALNRGPLPHYKKGPPGISERWALLDAVLPGLPPAPIIPPDFGGRCGIDDYVDAAVTAWTALCISRGQAHRVPDHPDLDGRGLRMEIWFPRP